jgi:hypothetical protein
MSKRKKGISPGKSRKKGQPKKYSIKSEKLNKHRSTSSAQLPPRTADELFAMPKRFQDLWDKAVQVPAEMRRLDLSLSQASRKFKVSTKTVLRVAGPAFTKKRGKYQVKPVDRLLRVLVIPGKKGLREIVVRDSREASVIGQYWSAVEKALGPAQDAAALLKLPRKTVRDENGKRVRLLTNLEELRRQASAGVLHFESLYGRRA